MDFDKKNFANYEITEGSEYKKILDEREELKKNIRENLVRINFNENEIGEVFAIIDSSYAEMEKAKNRYVNTDPSTDTNDVQEAVKINVNNIVKSMLSSLQKKVQEIKMRKLQEKSK